MNAPGSSSGHEGLSPAASVLLGLLRPVGTLEPVACVRDLPPQIWDEVLDIALPHGVAPLLHRALQLGNALDAVPEQSRVRLEEERRATAFANLRNLGEFRRVAQALREQDIPVIALKGLHLAELVYRDIGLRPMVDMDLLVPRSQRKDALNVLRKLG